MMTLRLPKPQNNARFLLVGYGLCLLIWLSLENRNMLFVAILGTGATIIYLGVAIFNRFHGRELRLRVWLPLMMMLGAILGALSTVTTASLMFFKSSWHGHLYPDFPPQMILSMLTRIPYWAISGALIGLCCGLVILLYQAQASK